MRTVIVLLASIGFVTAAWSGLEPLDVQASEKLTPRNCSGVEIGGQIIDPETGNVAGVGSPCVEIGVSYGFSAEARDAAHRDLSLFLFSILGDD